MPKTMSDLFTNQLQDAFSCETQIAAALPKMAKAAHSAELRAAFEKHLGETHNQVRRLDKVATQLNIKLTSNPCEATQGLVEEGEEIMAGGYEPEVLDAGLVGAAQKVEHYEIAMYGTLCTWAKKLGHADIARLLHESLDEEKKTDIELTRLAEAQVNHHAAQGVRHE